jgi:hypothetical protein
LLTERRDATNEEAEGMLDLGVPLLDMSGVAVSSSGEKFGRREGHSIGGRAFLAKWSQDQAGREVAAIRFFG